MSNNTQRLASNFPGDFPNESRVWIFPLRSPLEPEQRAYLDRALGDFIAGWKAHGEPVRAAFSVVASRFIVFAADETSTPVSGCSIDALFRTVDQAAALAGASIADPMEVLFRHGDQILCVGRDQFERYVSEDRVGPETVVFNNAVRTLGELRSGRWELPFAESWHARVFRKVA